MSIPTEAPSRRSVLEVDGLHKVFTTDDEDLIASNDVHFQVEPGEIFGLLGPNGAGKSTVMRMIVGLISPTAGTARLLGHDIRTDPIRVRENLGYLSATSGLPERLSCTEVLRLFAELQQADRPRDAVARSIERFGITDFASRRVEQLSTGMRQRVRIACACVHEPKVLILDEPTAGLDLLAADKLLDNIMALREAGASILFSTHVLREAARICDRIAIIHEGRIRAQDRPDELMRQTETSTLDDAFLAVVRA